MSATTPTVVPGTRRRTRGSVARVVSGHPSLVTAAAILVLASIGLIKTHKTVPLAVPRVQAIAAVRAEMAATPSRGAIHWTHAEVTPVDRGHEIVLLYAGARVAVQAIVDRNRTVSSATSFLHQTYDYGSNIANSPLMLGLLTLVFLLMTAVWPVRRVRNLDAGVAAATGLSVILTNTFTPQREVLVVFPLLLYLVGRCAWRGLGSSRVTPPATPLYEWMTRQWGDARRLRLLRLLAVMSMLLTAIIGLGSTNIVDVGYAVMEGATSIVHGLLPYGHVPGIVHGDTYPFGSYLLYVPLAWVTPVGGLFDNAELSLVVAVAAAFAVAWMLWRAGARRPSSHSSSGGRARELAGLRAATAWLTFPPLLVTISTGTTDVLLAAMLLGALLLWRRPAAVGSLLALGAWFKIYPLALLPLALAGQRGRDLLRSVTCVLAVSAAMLALLVGLGGFDAISAMLHAINYQSTRETPQTLWSLIGVVPFQQLAQAATLALIAGATVRVFQEPDLAASRPRLAAVSAAILLSLQISSGYWTYLYLAWVFPLLALSVLDPAARHEVSAR